MTNIVLNTKEFQSKTEAKNFFKEMLSKYKPSNVVDDLEDIKHLTSLLERHPERNEKVGVGISHFKVTNTKFSKRNFCFHIIRIDGTETDFSYINCIDIHSSQKEEVSKAFRWSVREYVQTRKKELFSNVLNGVIKCFDTGETITFEQVEMRYHKPNTFNVIVKTFLKDQDLDFDLVELTDNQDNQYSPELTDDVLKQKFLNYHNETAQLYPRKTS